jgi:acetyltransferase
VSVRNLDALFHPRSVAVVGASDRQDSVGATVVRNLLRAGFHGPVMPVHPGLRSVGGVLAYRDVASLPVPAELAVICTPPEPVPALVGELGRRGTRAAVLVAAGFGEPAGVKLLEAALAAARPHCLRLLGPNCLGVIVPGIGLNASFAHTDARPGELAFVSQSGALCTAVLDWARSAGVGFSHFVSLGNGADVDVGDALDYLAEEPATRAILLYVESVRSARKFLSAGRAAARNKPVLIVKSGRVRAGAQAAFSHTRALTSPDDVHDAAIRRAGMLRVHEIGELFDAVETLARARRLAGDRLAILTNGGGPGVMATDALVAGGGRLAELAPATLARLGEVLPAYWSRGNPVDVAGDASGERYATALAALLDDPGLDACLVLHAPTAMASSEDAARAVVRVAAQRERRTPILASWLGGAGAEPARRILREAGIPSYATPDDAVRAFLQLLEYRRNQELLMETPPSLPEGLVPRTEEARALVAAALAAGREILDPDEVRALLDAYGLPVVAMQVAADAAAAVRAAEALGPPVALKLLSPDVVHKSDVGGVALDLDGCEAVRAAAEGMAERLQRLQPGARLQGFVVQAMARRPGAHELLVGATSDPVFGPVMLFGQGGTAAERIADRAVALPPLNAHLARDLVSRTRVARLLGGWRERPAVDEGALHLALVRVAQAVAELPEIQEIEVNPLLADEKGVLALDARVRIAPAQGAGADRLAIRPYPTGLEERMRLRDGRSCLVRPIRPEDEPAHDAFLQRLDAEDVYFRFFTPMRRLPHSELARYTQIDYDREMAFIATLPADGAAGGETETLGVVRAISDPDNCRAEFAIVVRSDLKGQGLGRALMEKIIRYCRSRGTRELVGQVLPANRAMLELAQEFGFASRLDPELAVVSLRLAL